MSEAAYVDSSALLRVIFDEPGKCKMLETCTELYSSDLIRAECLRTCYRAHVESKISDRELAEKISLTIKLVSSIHLVPISPAVITRAGQSFPVHLKTLDSIHIATLALLAEKKAIKLTFLTHDVRMEQASLAMGLA